MSNEQTVQSAYRKLIAQATSRRQRESLERVKQACDFLEKNRIRITPTSSGRYCVERWGGPKPQSIRNSVNVLFKYMRLRQAAQILPPSGSKTLKEPVITDEAVRAYVYLLREERDEAIRAKNRILKGLKSVPGISIDALISGQFGGSTGNPENETSADKPRLVAIARALLSPEKLDACGLELYKGRIRNTITGALLVEKADVAILQALLSNVAADNK